MTQYPPPPSRKSLLHRLIIAFCFLSAACGLASVGLVLYGTGVIIHEHLTCQGKTGTASRVRDLRNAARLYMTKTGRYPTPEEGLEVLVPFGVLEELPKDPWGRPYRYTLRDGEPVVWTLGADDAPGGEKCDRDYSSEDAS